MSVLGDLPVFKFVDYDGSLLVFHFVSPKSKDDLGKVLVTEPYITSIARR